MRTLTFFSLEKSNMHRIFCIACTVLVASSLFAQNAPETTNPTAVMKTSSGEIRIELLADKAPVTVANFIQYARAGFYNGTIFHRVISHFMIQGGGLTPDMKEKDTVDPIVNESNNGLSNQRGTISMARTAFPDSATSQFFINVENNANLDFAPGGNSPKWGYAVFGKVTAGMEVVDEIRFVETATIPPHADVPKVPVVIESVEIIDPTKPQP